MDCILEQRKTFVKRAGSGPMDAEVKVEVEVKAEVDGGRQSDAHGLRFWRAKNRSEDGGGKTEDGGRRMEERGVKMEEERRRNPGRGRRMEDSRQDLRTEFQAATEALKKGWKREE